MPLPAPQPRSPSHTRTAVYNAFRRNDGLWDIEGELRDTKSYVFKRHEDELAPGELIHGMSIRATVNDAMTIVEVVSSMDRTPFPECSGSMEPLQGMVGVTMGPGWRKAIDRALGETRGCTHLRELLFNMATVAFQAIPAYQDHARRQQGLPDEGAEPPYHLGKCLGWAFDGPVVQRYYPRFAGWQPLKKLPRSNT